MLLTRWCGIGHGWSASEHDAIFLILETPMKRIHLLCYTSQLFLEVPSPIATQTREGFSFLGMRDIAITFSGTDLKRVYHCKMHQLPYPTWSRPSEIPISLTL